MYEKDGMAVNERQPNEERKPGPDLDHLKIKGEWEEAVKKALKKKAPSNGWPEPPPKYKKRKKGKGKRK